MINESAIELKERQREREGEKESRGPLWRPSSILWSGTILQPSRFGRTPSRVADICPFRGGGELRRGERREQRSLANRLVNLYECFDSGQEASRQSTGFRGIVAGSVLPKLAREGAMRIPRYDSHSTTWAFQLVISDSDKSTFGQARSTYHTLGHMIRESGGSCSLSGGSSKDLVEGTQEYRRELRRKVGRSKHARIQPTRLIVSRKAGLCHIPSPSHS
ncbi:hypothetical protein OE88DRAFT_71114 [Heliocybe sulcata]|uniref:Uncharacterized protein n=1 Tax=Heliocybe sulcata TaxID=5364 RepID=A0A5C3NG96_9AGAM|nr:hypothetical protein OE88DRAFT_71114 [Heliocybe sulcata]